MEGAGLGHDEALAEAQAWLEAQFYQRVPKR